MKTMANPCREHLRSCPSHAKRGKGMIPSPSPFPPPPTQKHDGWDTGFYTMVLHPGIPGNPAIVFFYCELFESSYSLIRTVTKSEQLANYILLIVENDHPSTAGVRR